MRSKVNIDDLELLDEPDILEEGSSGKGPFQTPVSRYRADGTDRRANRADGADRRTNRPQSGNGRGGRGSAGSGVRMEKAMNAATEINLLGMRVDEACAELDKFIDDAVIAHIDTVRIIHGKGTGRLREGIHAYLRSNRSVKSFHLAEFGQGDAGVTIAELNV